MVGKRYPLALVGALALVLSLTVGLAATGTAAAKTKKKGGSKAALVDGSAGAVPQGATSNTVNPVPFLGTATVGNKFKGKTVGDVDATINALGVTAPGTTCGGICDLVVRLTAPNGAQTGLIFGGPGVFGASGNAITNLTLSDQTPTRTCGGTGTPFTATAPPPPCRDPDATLLAPYTGTAQPTGFMNFLNGSPVKGTWTLTAFDFCGAAFCGGDAGTSTIIGWSLKITPARAPR